MNLEGKARNIYADLQRRRRHRRNLRFTEATDRSTVYYLCRDHNEPAGGMRCIYRHVDLLNAAGIDAFVMHQRRGFRCTWFDHDTRITDERSTLIRPSDLIVVPETDGDILPSLPRGLRHVIFNQSGHLTWDRASAAVTQHCLTNPDLLGVMVVSAHSRQLLEYAFGHHVHQVRQSIDPTLFYPACDPPSRQIAYMSRRGRADAERTLEILRGRGALAGWSVLRLDGLRHEEVAKKLRASMIFLSTAYQEGFGLPAVEAMASGAYVVGFDGFGGREFFLPEFSSRVPVGDLLEMAKALEACLSREAAEPGWCRSRGLRAAAHVRVEYSPEVERSTLLSFFKELEL